MSKHKQDALAIVGMACRFPKAEGLDQYWGNLLTGTDCIEEIPDSHWRLEDYFDADPSAVGEEERKHRRKGAGDAK